MSKKKKLLASIISLVVLIAIEIYFLSTYDHFKAEGGLKVEMGYVPEDYLQNYARESLDFDFVMEDAIRSYKQNGGDFLAILAESNKKRLKKPLIQLLNYREVPELTGESEDDDVIDFLRERFELNLEIAENFYRQRMEYAMDKEVIVKSNSEEMKLTIEILGQRDSLDAEDFRLPQVNLGFYACVPLNEFVGYWNEVCELSNSMIDVEDQDEWALQDSYVPSHPSMKKLENAVKWDPKGFGIVQDKDKEFVAMKLDDPEIRDVLPEGLRFLWSRESNFNGQEGLWSLYLVRIPDNGPIISNDDVQGATFQSEGSYGEPVLDIRMTREGTVKWAQMTGDNINRMIAMCVNGEVMSAPNVMARINGGATQISGGDASHLKDIEIVLNSQSREIISSSFRETFVKGNPPLLNSTLQKILLALSILLLLFFGVQYFRTSRSN